MSDDIRYSLMLARDAARGRGFDADADAYDESLAAAKELIAAVAELIEAAISGREQLRDAARLLRGDDKLNCQVISDHLDAAIARATGELA